MVAEDVDCRVHWVCILAIPLTSYMILGKLLNFSGYQFPHLLYRNNVPTSKSGCEDEVRRYI